MSDNRMSGIRREMEGHSMKKRVCLLVVLLALVIMGSTMSVEAAEIIDQGYCGGEGDGKNLTWTLDRDGVLVIEGQGKMKDWIEEETSPLVENYHPTDWHKHFDVINSVIVQSGVTSIGNNAFRNCKSISNIVVPETVTSIGHEAFCDCASLNSIELPKSLRVMGYGAFSDCSSLSSINLPESLTSMGDRAFSGCESLGSIDLPKSFTVLGYGVFCDCTSLSSINLPESLISIGDDAFSGCESLSSINLPGSLVSIGNGAFEYCTNLSSINLPEALTSIGHYAFTGCESLDSIDLPESLTNMGRAAFSLCKSLSHIALPQSITSLESTFVGCSNLNSVDIPSSVVSIGQAFADANLQDVFYGGKKAQWNNINIIPRYYWDNYDGLGNATIHYEEDDYEKVKDFVLRLYRNILKREPDESGWYDWVEALMSGRATGAKVVAGFVLSPEYIANSLGNEEYITALYHIIFSREPDVKGLNAWMSVMENGCTNKKVLAGFINSVEFNNLCRDLGIATGSYYSDELTDQNVKKAAFVARLYKICLERAYEQEGLYNWVNALASYTITGSSVAKNFFNSQEFKNRELDDTSFVTVAYQAILDREPDPSGLKSWIDALSQGYTRNNVLSGFLKSIEFDNLCAEYRIVSGNARKARDVDFILLNGEMIYDADGLSDRELRLARNEIYARRGYIFSDAEMAEYFGKKAWYKPSILAKDFDEHIFNRNEWSSIEEILAEEENRAHERATLNETERLGAEIDRFLGSSPANGFLRSRFTEPGFDISLVNVIYLLGELGVDDDTFTFEMIKTGDVPLFVDISCIKSDKLDELLYRLTGYGLYEKKWNLSDLPYLKSIDTYYFEHGDTNYSCYEIEKVKSLGNSIYEVITEEGLIIKLKRVETGGYQFISVLGA